MRDRDLLDRLAAANVGLRETLIQYIKDLKPGGEINLDSWSEVITYELKMEIYRWYIEVVDVNGTPTYASFPNIAEYLFPDSYKQSPTIAKEIVSQIGQFIHYEYWLNELRSNSLTRTLKNLNETDEETALRLVKEFHEKRKGYVRATIAEKNKGQDPEYYLKTRIKAAHIRGNFIWTIEKFNRIKELVALELWPEGTISAGKPNWDKIAAKLIEEYQIKRPDEIEEATFVRKMAKRFKDSYHVYDRNQSDLVTDEYVNKVLSEIAEQ